MPLDIIQQEIYTGSINIRAHSSDSPLSSSVCPLSGNSALVLAWGWLKAYSFLFCVSYSLLNHSLLSWVARKPKNNILLDLLRCIVVFRLYGMWSAKIIVMKFWQGLFVHCGCTFVLAIAQYIAQHSISPP